ncbi:MAG: BlaI/MecI/CopY family transcriptional regulator [Clostridia bacterium]|nr:BlaI/MecI/CopY family transcriptional regulator [Clostridia bacterium]
MEKIQLGAIESQFADLVWENEPLSSAQLCALCATVLSWKKSTTFTVLRRLCDKGLFQNIKSTVTSRMTKAEFQSLQSEQFVEDTFQGSLPAFLAAFTKQKKLTAQEVEELRRLVEQYEEG